MGVKWQTLTKLKKNNKNTKPLAFKFFLKVFFFECSGHDRKKSSGWQVTYLNLILIMLRSCWGFDYKDSVESLPLSINMFTWASGVCVCEWSSGRAVVGKEARPHLEDFLLSVFLVNIQSFSLYGWDKVWRGDGVVGRRHHDAQILKLSPQPHVPLMLGLLKTNSLDSFDSTKSISVPRRVSWAFFSMNTLTPAKRVTVEPSLLTSSNVTINSQNIAWLYVAKK